MIRRLVLMLVLAAAGQCATGTGKAPEPSRPPILETVWAAGQSGNVVGMGPGGRYDVYPAVFVDLRMRAQFGAKFTVAVDGVPAVEVPRAAASHPEHEATGFYSVTHDLVSVEDPWLAYRLYLKLPEAKRSTTDQRNPVQLAVSVVRDIAALPADQRTSQPLLVTFSPWYLSAQGQGDPDAMTRPSQVFDDEPESQNTKNDGRALTSIVARDVTLAGWLHAPFNNEGIRAGQPRTEDFHYDLFIDPDFVRRNYLPGSVPDRLRGAKLPGNTSCQFLGCVGRQPATVQLLAPGTAPTIGTFMLPAWDSPFSVELNAWHRSTRNNRVPPGWVPDPNPAYSDNFWPFRPDFGLGGDRSFQPGDYVIVTGTLWQDSAHIGGTTDSDPDPAVRNLRCWDRRFQDHAGYLEIHPVDSVRRVEPAPARRKHPHVLGVCAGTPNAASETVDTYYAPEPATPPTDKSILRFEEIVDSRFTVGAPASKVVEVDACDPTRLHVAVTTSGTYAATYLLWWEEGSAPRPSPTGCVGQRRDPLVQTPPPN